MCSYVCVKCGRQCECYNNNMTSTKLCSVCFNKQKTANEQKEPFKSDYEVGVPDDVRKVEPKHVTSITDLIRDEAKKRAMRNECNGVYKRSADVEVPACGICAKPVSLDMILKTQSGTRICEECHHKLYREPNQALRDDNLKSSWDMCPRCQSKDFKHFDGMIICNKCGRMDMEYVYDPVKHVIYRIDADGNPTVDTTKEPAKPLQSEIEERYDCIPQEALQAVARVMGSGTRKYGPRNWDKISYEDHVNHALRHINLALLGDTKDEQGTKAHLSHAMCRLFFAYETYKEISE